MLRIIDNKRVDLTEDEFRAYEELCKSYDRPNFNGKDLFANLFETNEDGVIIFLRPPGKKYISLEIITFLQNIMVHQHLRMMYDKIESAVSDYNKQCDGMAKEIVELRKRVDTLSSDIRELLPQDNKSSD